MDARTEHSGLHQRCILSEAAGLRVHQKVLLLHHRKLHYNVIVPVASYLNHSVIVELEKGLNIYIMCLYKVKFAINLSWHKETVLVLHYRIILFRARQNDLERVIVGEVCLVAS